MKQMPRRTLIGAALAVLAQISLFGRQAVAAVTTQEASGDGKLQGAYEQLLAKVSELSGRLAHTPPVGSIVPFAGPTSSVPPEGWLICDGRPLSRDGDYKDLFAMIGTAWGAGNGPNSFSLPDLRGRFLRGLDDTTEGTRDPDRANRVASAPGGNSHSSIGSVEEDDFKTHGHVVIEKAHWHDTTGDAFWNGHGAAGMRYILPAAQVQADPPNNTSHKIPAPDQPGGYYHIIQPAITGITNAETGGRETRPKNAAVYWIIRAKY